MTGTIRERFESKYTKTDGCWEWTASKGPNGYGQFHLAGRPQRTHRVAYQMYVGEIPDGMCVLHRCDNRRCVRPGHLFLGTYADNNRDCVKKGRSGGKGRGLKTSGEKNANAKLTEEQVKMIRTMWAAGARNVDLSREFRMHHSTISDIVYGRYWANLCEVQA